MGSDVPLPRSFYERAVEDVADDLLGCFLVRRYRRRTVGGRIVEVEAYGGPGDPGSHADRAPDGRARIMFGEPGRAYVYFTYGMHHCLNAITGPEGQAGGVLIRALEPVWGLDRMRTLASPRLPEHLLCSGPGRLCRALGIDRELNGADLVEGPIRILGGQGPVEVRRSERIGLSRDDGREWRRFVDSASVSRQSQPPGST